MDKQFLTQDFYLAATAMASGFELLDYYREGGFTTFVLRETPKLSEFIKNYYSELITVEAVRHARSIKSLKSICHSLSLSTIKSPSKNELSSKRKGC